MQSSKCVRDLLMNAAPGPYLVPIGVPQQQWLNVPKTDQELKALINTMILVWECREARKKERHKRGAK